MVRSLKDPSIFAYIFDEPRLPDLRGKIGNFSGNKLNINILLHVGSTKIFILYYS